MHILRVSFEVALTIVLGTCVGIGTFTLILNFLFRRDDTMDNEYDEDTDIDWP